MCLWSQEYKKSIKVDFNKLIDVMNTKYYKQTLSVAAGYYTLQDSVSMTDISVMSVAGSIIEQS